MIEQVIVLSIKVLQTNLSKHIFIHSLMNEHLINIEVTISIIWKTQ